MTREVSIIQQVLPQYRVPFFDQLRTNLAADGVRLRLLHGQSPLASGAKGDERELDWAEHVANYTLPLPRGRSLNWQPILTATRGSDLVVLEHAARHVSSWPLIMGSGPRIAFWGHGTNLQGSPAGALAERMKRWASRRAHWWFAYTDGAADRVASHDFPRERITVVRNTVSTSKPRDLPSRDRFTCVYVGALYDLKRIAFLLEAGEHLAEILPGFRLIVLGSGPDRDLLEEAVNSFSWLDFRGATFDDAKAATLASSSLMLMPGLVGLAIVDAFAHGCPLITTDQPFHSPEIEYLRQRENGIMLPRETTPAEYAESVAGLLNDPKRLDALRAGCSASADTLSMSSMVERFARGVLSALDAPRR